MATREVLPDLQLGECNNAVRANRKGALRRGNGAQAITRNPIAPGDVLKCDFVDWADGNRRLRLIKRLVKPTERY